MCGFFGCFGFENKDLNKSREALHTLEHRGKDQWNEWYKDNFYLGHRRLSIIDLSENGIQPFSDRDIILAVNGEIYNFQILRKELGEHLFKSNSDSEIILHGYKSWGIDGLLKRLDGMYAFALYDLKKEKLFLVKDKWGKKPLFYAQINNQLVFASEAKALLKYEETLRKFSYNGIQKWIRYRGSHDSQTIFHGVYRLSPGSYIEKECGKKIKVKRHYNLIEKVLNNSSKISSEEDFIENLSNVISKSIEKRLISDVPLGLQLSGGIDSSLIAAYLSKKTKGELHTFSVGFLETEYKQYSEEKYSTYVAEKWGLNHHAFGISKKMIGDNFKNVLYIFDGMLDYPNAIPLFLLNSFSKKYISVALTGEAADELFGGYRKYLQINNLKRKNLFYRMLPNILFRKSISNKFNKGILRPAYLKKKYSGNIKKIINDFNAYISSDTMDRFFGHTNDSLLSKTDYQKLEQLPPLRQVLLVDHITYLYSLLDRQDRTSMGANIEARLPFIDQDLVEWISTVDPKLLFDEKQNKIPLKKLSERIYGKEFTYRPKMGFPLPLEEWLESEDCFGNYYNKIFNDEFLLYKYVDKMKLEKWFNDYSFSNKLLNYSDSEKMWMKWFLMVLRSTQDIFGINEIVD